MHIYVSVASGRGWCVKCGKKINSGERQIVATGFREEARAHVSCVLVN